MNIPQPDLPLHVDNLVTLELLEAQGWQGADASLAESLFEYGLAWRQFDPPYEGDDYGFIYEITGRRPLRFDRCGMSSQVDLYREHNWLDDNDWANLYRTHGMTRAKWDAQPFPIRIGDLLRQWGRENIIGDSYWEGFAIRDPDHDYGKEYAPGETEAEYTQRQTENDA